MRSSPATTWSVTAAAGGSVTDGPVGADVPTRWEQAGRGRALTWLEPRALYRPGLPSDEVLAAAGTTVLAEWAVPIEVDGKRIDLAGTTRWVPIEVGEADRAPAEGAPRADPDLVLLGVGAATATAASVLVLGRRRVRRRP